MALVSASETSDLPLPRPLGRYTLLKLIARGGMGEVFLAATGGIEGAERPCVVKVIRREHAKDPSFLARFLDEARVQSQLTHPGVAQILEASMEADEPYVVVEYVEGRSLAEVRSRAIQMAVRVGWADAVAIAASLAEALWHVHDRVDVRGTPLAIAHRDLSPQNVMIGFGGDTKLIDFGTARGANRKSRTVAGVVYAKPGYVAPEVANGVPGDALVDVYALGVMLWELCAGRRFLQGDAQEHMVAVGENKRSLPPVASMVSAPPELDSVITMMTAHAKTARATAREAHAELVKLLASAPGLPTGERGVRARIGALMTTLYPSEPKRSRVEFQKMLEAAKAAREAEAAKPAAAAPEGPAPEVAGPETAPKPPTNDAPDVLPGTRYRIVGTLGEGASGVVHEAVHIDLSRRVALKILAPERAGDAARFRREACALSELSHPGLVRFYDFGVATDGRLFFAMEYLEGETLEKRLSREETLPVPEALRITKDALSALSVAHDAGLVHRDVKPGNLFLTTPGDVKVFDFGVAYDTDAARDTGATPGVSLYGTPEYMAPEQADGAVDARADVYAMGAVLYEMLTGRLPYPGVTGVAVLEQKRRTLPERPSERAPMRGIPASIDGIVMKALSPRPEDRFGSATEMRAAIEAAEATPERVRGKRRGVAALAVASVMTAAIALIGAGLVQKSPRARDAWTQAVTRVNARLGRAPQPMPEPSIAVIDKLPPPEAPAAPEAAPAPALTSAVDDPRAEVPTPSTAAIDEVIDEPAPAAKPDEDPKSARMKAKKAAGKRRWKLARKYAEEWIKTDPGTEGRIVLAKALSHTGHAAEARETLTALLEAHPACDEARELLHDLDTKSAYKAPRAAEKSEKAEKAEKAAAAKKHGKVAMAKGKKQH